MIAYLKGELVVKSEEYIIIEVQGIGYKVFMSKKSIDELQQTSTSIYIFESKRRWH